MLIYRDGIALYGKRIRAIRPLVSSIVGTGDCHPYGKHFIEVIEVRMRVDELGTLHIGMEVPQEGTIIPERPATFRCLNSPSKFMAWLKRDKCGSKS
jgi:hypothetical protein